MGVLFTLKKYVPHSFEFTNEMKLATLRTEDEVVTNSVGKPIIDKVTGKVKTVKVTKGVLDESQVKKFCNFPELLLVELDNEESHPDIANLEKDIFDAVFNNDYIKFFNCAMRVGFDKTILSRLYNWLLNKDDFKKRDLALLKRIEGAKSVFNIFDY